MELDRRIVQENIWHMYDYERMIDLNLSNYHKLKKKVKKEKTTVRDVIASAVRTKSAVNKFK